MPLYYLSCHPYLYKEKITLQSMSSIIPIPVGSTNTSEMVKINACIRDAWYTFMYKIILYTIPLLVLTGIPVKFDLHRTIKKNN